MYDPNKPKETVRSWFKDAKNSGRRVTINLYFSPFNKAFRKLAKPAMYGKLQVGWEFDGCLFEIEYSSLSDCEEMLICRGKI